MQSGSALRHISIEKGVRVPPAPFRARLTPRFYLPVGRRSSALLEPVALAAVGKHRRVVQEALFRGAGYAVSAALVSSRLGIRSG